MHGPSDPPRGLELPDRTMPGLLRPQTADSPTTPLDVTQETRTGLSELSEDGTGAYWLWVVAGETAARGARRAVRLAAALFDL